MATGTTFARRQKRFPVSDLVTDALHKRFTVLTKKSLNCVSTFLACIGENTFDIPICIGSRMVDAIRVATEAAQPWQGWLDHLYT